MLNMKHTWNAVMTLGLALLLGPGLAMAERINLTGGSTEGLGPLSYASETVPVPASTATGRFALEVEEAFQIAVKPRRAINSSEEIYVRIDLTGAHFGDEPNLVAGALMTTATPPVISTETLGALEHTLSSGGTGSSFAVLKIGTAGAGAVVAAENLIAVEIPASGANGHLQLTSTSGHVSAKIAAYTNPDDALDEKNPRSTFGGSGTIVRLVSGLTVTIDAADSADAGENNAVASVDHGFRRFVGPTGQAKLGWLGVQEKIGAGVRHAVGGAELTANQVLSADARIEFHILGNLNIGAFSLIDSDYNPMPAAGTAKSTTSCQANAAGSVDPGTLKDANGMPLVGEDGELPSGVDRASSGILAANTDTNRARLLCVNVDVMGPATNMSPIPTGGYSAVAFTKAAATADGVMVGEGNLASITRNGASVEIPYLTTSSKHNQRLIIVNRGSRPAAITDITFTMEDGTEVELTDDIQTAYDSGMLAVPPMSSWTRPISDVIEITGNSRRVAASLAFAATGGNLSVATTQVNLGDSSTDTVVYEVMGR